jgi:hypothetical protein
MKDCDPSWGMQNCHATFKGQFLQKVPGSRSTSRRNCRLVDCKTGSWAVSSTGNSTGRTYAAINAIAREASNIQLRLYQVTGDDHEEQDNYELLEVTYPFGSRCCRCSLASKIRLLLGQAPSAAIP